MAGKLVIPLCKKNSKDPKNQSTESREYSAEENQNKISNFFSKMIASKMVRVAPGLLVEGDRAKGVVTLVILPAPGLPERYHGLHDENSIDL